VTPAEYRLWLERGSVCAPPWAWANNRMHDTIRDIAFPAANPRLDPSDDEETDR
jgi:hypothetical protein